MTAILSRPQCQAQVHSHIIVISRASTTLQRRHNDHDRGSNHQPHGCLLNRLFRRRSKKTSKLRVTGLCVGNSPGPVNSPHKWPVTWKMFPFDFVIMKANELSLEQNGRHFADVIHYCRMHFVEWKLLYFHLNFTKLTVIQHWFRQCLGTMPAVTDYLIQSWPWSTSIWHHRAQSQWVPKNL